MNCDVLQRGDLVERYLDADLDEPTRVAVEAHYFDCAACLEALQVARAVREEFARPAWQARARQLAMAASVLLAVGVLGAWIVLLLRENRDLDRRLALASAAQAQRERQTGELASLRDQLTALSQPQLNAPIVDLEPHPAVRGRDADPRTIELTSDVRLMTFVLTADETHDSPSSSVALLDGAGQVLWQASGLRKSRFDTFTVTVPARMLPAGRAALRVGATTYDFLVVRR